MYVVSILPIFLHQIAIGAKIDIFLLKKSHLCFSKALVSFNALIEGVKFFLPTLGYIILI